MGNAKEDKAKIRKLIKTSKITPTIKGIVSKNKNRLTRKLRVELGIGKMIGGQEYSFLDHAKTKKEAIQMKNRYASKVYSVRVTKNKGEYPYKIWMSRRKM